MIKKLFLSLLLMGLCINARAAIISYNQLSSDAGVSYTHLNNSFTAIYNDYNGNIGSSNILDGTLTNADFATAVKPSTLTSENIGDYTYTGMLPPTSASLTAITTAGTSYVSGNRVATDATSKTYTASKDTWVYIDQNGAFAYQEVANGGAQPTTQANTLLLAKVVTNGTAVTSVTDSRQLTPPNLRVYTDFKSGMALSRDISTATKITVFPGSIELGVGTGNIRRNTSGTTVDFTVNGSGGLDTGSLSATTYYYIFAVADSANSTNFKAIASTSSSDATGVTGEKLIGWCYAPTTAAISPDSIGAYRWMGGDAPNIAKNIVSADQAINDSSYSTDLDRTTTRFFASGRPCKITATTKFYNVAGADLWTVINIDGVIQYDTESAGHTDAATVQTSCVNQWTGTLSPGTHTIKIQGRIIAGQTNTVTNTYLIVEEL